MGHDQIHWPKKSAGRNSLDIQLIEYRVKQKYAFLNKAPIQKEYTREQVNKYTKEKLNDNEEIQRKLYDQQENKKSQYLQDRQHLQDQYRYPRLQQYGHPCLELQYGHPHLQQQYGGSRPQQQ